MTTRRLQRATRSLRRLDDRTLPTAARLLRRGVQVLARPTSAPSGTDAGAPAPEPHGSRSWRDRLDDRFARGPLALVRELPQVGLLAVAAVFLAGTAVVLADRSDRSAVSVPQEAGPPPLGALPGEAGLPNDVAGGAGLADLGPARGQQVDAYLAGAAARLAVAAASAGPFLALVSLDAPLTAQEVAPLLGGAGLVAVLVQVPGTGASASVTLLDATTAPAGVSAALRDRAATRRGDADELRTLAGTVDPSTQEETDAKALFTAEAAAATAEAAQLGATCACVAALVVKGSGAALSALSGKDGVRVVDPAAPGAGTVADVRLLPPGAQGAVPEAVVQRG